MNDIITLWESAPAPTKVGSRWLVTVARPGQGSTGMYPESVLKETGPVAFPPGTKAFFNHDPKRDVRDMVGTYPDGAFWNDEAGELQAYLVPFPRYQDVLTEAGSNIEASIHAKASKDVTGTVRSLLADRGNTVDLVAFAGLEGSGLKYQVESLFAAAAAVDENGKKEENMEITKEMWDAQNEALTNLATSFADFVKEHKSEVQGQADEAAVELRANELVSEALAVYIEKEKAIKDAKLFSKQEESLIAKALKGDDITDELAAATEIANEARKEAAPDAKGSVRGNVVVVTESRDSNAPKKTYKLGG